MQTPQAAREHLLNSTDTLHPEQFVSIPVRVLRLALTPSAESGTEPNADPPTPEPAIPAAAGARAKKS